MATKKNEFRSISPYQRIEQDLRRRIAGGDWAIGAALPSRRDLAGEYEVALKTVQRAVAPLVADGTLEANPRRGTVLAARPRQAVPREAVLTPEPKRLGRKTLTRPRILTRPRTLPPPETSASESAERVLASAERVLAAPATLGVVTSFFPDRPLTGAQEYWVRSVLTALDVAFSRAGGHTSLFNRVQPDRVVTPFLDAVRRALDAGVDALVVVDLDEHEGADAYVETMSAAGRDVPLVLINSRAFDWPVSHVFYDQRMAGYQAAQHLIRRGFRQLVFLSPFAADWAEARVAGAKAALSHAGLPPAALHIHPAERTEQVQGDVNFGILGYRAMRGALGALALPGMGVIAANDGTALGARQAGLEAGLTAGVDYGLIGFDDNPEATQQGISTMRPPLEAMGEEAARLVTQALRGQTATAQVRLRSHLIARASTAPRREVLREVL